MNEQRSTTSADYQEDFYAWTQRQAKLLRSLNRLSAELPAEIDLSHLADEIEDLGKAELRGATSLIRNIFIHLIKAASDRMLRQLHIGEPRPRRSIPNCRGFMLRRCGA